MGVADATSAMIHAIQFGGAVEQLGTKDGEDAAGGNWQLTDFLVNFQTETLGKWLYIQFDFLAYVCSNGWGKKSQLEDECWMFMKFACFILKRLLKSIIYTALLFQDVRALSSSTHF